MRTLHKVALVLLTIHSAFLFAAKGERPNVIIILSDDQGWGDVGFNGATDIPTPHLDRLAADGTIFNAGYAAHPYCSPSRAGLMAGVYQHRFGHDNNTPYKHDDPEAGLPLDQTMLSEVLQENGYATAAIGKWHLGDFPKFWPNNRGFDYWYGMYSGGMSYWGDQKAKTPKMDRILRNGEIVPFDEITYLTDDFTNEAISFIDREKENPFFIYLAYNAPHGPIHATSEYLDKVEHIEDGKRAAYAGLVVGLDEGVGKVVQKLKDEGIYDNTLIFFYSDNGAMRHGASSYPYRGFKGMLFEGGIRVPFCVTWGDRFLSGAKLDEPITALDIFPTVLSAAGIEQSPELGLEGLDLTPMLSGESSSLPSRELYWRVSGGAGYAVRQGDYKLVHSIFKPEPFLFNLRDDPYENTNLAKQMPEKFQEMLKLYKSWNTQNIEPKWDDPHFANRDKEVEGRESYIRKAKAGEKK
ncbi:sulfatase-like hydrolase/transferase [Pelagicoccus mobilis]|uniref:Sulfatase-like hydrolase/transferase n=1 Tax=Pelagicoccus mobilis TaxID=415221 RepID=A0A934RTV0_9BACT|nr:sulfatase-like hydrolase/transferase [Pelagicoccus mobilis]MBK1875295.1 sulfatase-like hydrolase/transferase [Pelagicoccus mobilis]